MNSIESQYLVPKVLRRKLIFLGFDIKQMVNLNGFTGILYSQAFDWFDDKYKLNSNISINSKSHLGNTYKYCIINHTDYISEYHIINSFDYKSKEEAKLTCLEKLIELVTEKKK